MYHERGDDPSTYHVSGVGYVDYRRPGSSLVVMASKEYADDFRSPETVPTQEQPFDRPYVFHAMCWDMLVTNLGCADGSQEAMAVLYWLFHIFNCMPKTKTGELLPEHCYHGIRAFRNKISSIPPNFPDAAEELLLEEDFTDLNLSPSDLGDGKIDWSSGSGNFSKFPVEVFHHILNFLPSRDMSCLRISSRAIAQATCPSRLPQSFWASRFQPDMDMGFICGGYLQGRNLRGTRSWRRFYGVCRAGLRSRRSPLFQLLRMMWLSIGDFAVAVRELLAGRDVADNYMHEWPSTVDDSLCQWIASPEHGNDTEPRASFGTAERKRGVLKLERPRPSDTLVLKVYFITFNCRTYISGFGLYCVRHEHGQGLELLQELGVITSTEQALCLQPGDNITAIDVAMPVTGICGLRFFVDRGGDTIVVTVGELHLVDVFCGVARLEVTNSLFGISLAFDVRPRLTARASCVC